MVGSGGWGWRDVPLRGDSGRDDDTKANVKVSLRATSLSRPQFDSLLHLVFSFLTPICQIVSQRHGMLLGTHHMMWINLWPEWLHSSLSLSLTGSSGVFVIVCGRMESKQWGGRLGGDGVMMLAPECCSLLIKSRHWEQNSPNRQPQSSDRSFQSSTGWMAGISSTLRTCNKGKSWTPPRKHFGSGEM